MTATEDGRTVSEPGSVGPWFRFADFHEPGLEAGDYRLTATQRVHGSTAGSETVDERTEETTLSFTVAGPRFSLPDGQIASVFPPEKSNAPFTGALPHVVLHNSLLPWLRSAHRGRGADDRNRPWLAVLVFTQAEWNDPEQVGRPTDGAPALTVEDLFTSDETVQFVAHERESQQHPDDAVDVIDVDADLAVALSPSFESLPLTCHTRSTVDDLGEGADEADRRAIVTATRMLWPGDDGSDYVACLVSLEDRWPAETTEVATPDGATRLPHHVSPTKIRFVVLHKWAFHCRPELPNLHEVVADALDADGQAVELHYGQDLALRLPPRGDVQRDRLAAGFVPIQHHMRDGSRSAAWYRGPLVPHDVPLPSAERIPEVRHADALLSFNEELGMFDVSYAAAWELGRSLALADREFSVRLLQWKRRHRHDLHRQHQLFTGALRALPLHHHHDRGEDFDPERRWLRDSSLFARISRLERIPWRYLVPSPDLLPLGRSSDDRTRSAPGSIRVFQVDPLWMECLRDGVFSVGRVTAGDAVRDEGFHADHVPTQADRTFGVLLRVPKIDAWPDLRVSAWWPTSGERSGGFEQDHVRIAEPVRIGRPGPGLLLALFSLAGVGDVDPMAAPAAFDLYTPRETMHAGFDYNHDEGAWQRIVRDPNTGMELDATVPLGGTILDPDRQTVDFRAFWDALADRTENPPDRQAHALALTLLDAPDRVRIHVPATIEVSQ